MYFFFFYILLLQSKEEKFLAKEQRKQEKRYRKDMKPSTEDQEIADALAMSPEELRRTRWVEYHIFFFQKAEGSDEVMGLGRYTQNVSQVWRCHKNVL